MSDTPISLRDEVVKKQPSTMTNSDAMERSNTVGSVVFETHHLDKLCSALENSNGTARKLTSTTAISLGGFVLCTTPLSMVLLGWQGASGSGAGNLGSWIWLGGIVTIVGAIGDWITGHIFPAIVFSLFGGFWCSFGTMLVPDAGAFSAYSTDPNNPAEGLTEPAFSATVAFFLMAMSFLCLIFLLASLRVNVAFCFAFAGLIPTMDLLAASYWAAADGKTSKALTLQHGSAGCLLAVSLLGWYILAALVLPTVDFPVVLPLGDLSHRIKGASQRARRQNPGFDV
ncbi:hypothetical protein A1O1_07867 [Capronia coronata CBS 617.96]|uniref:GPR1/FUN34/YaaH-class plasma membrane protein n=1 Tax=Capronia coronata CBS 617.96 TaxID=1182541 RepID=W9XMN5_9EURO|nr:uncharacterized protein A1O1_07867 [Capronia coronata CBS 617.96]EXJ81802.1 hypothetical protein A1O1_07867 [Capronia coronata CBS 617.96]